jgi:hypothetical protein
MPHVSVVKKASSLEASLTVPPRKNCNVVCKRIMKKLEVSEATRQEVSIATSVVEY